ncbi:hypothetical protein [Pelagicoccus albus]|uniref:Uncharacterized protein n=1 Tax=Pelagicoccus albus TaxID=415222 RepID=A0A7X1E7G4_9BACT|nr:hypothetical protein [Pelagicoccus albus]MBC2605705.1 hypothetical protein [Pelagicoccus albus]
MPQKTKSANVTSLATSLLLVVISMFIQACNSTYEMQVDAINSQQSQIPDADSYVLVPGDPETDTSTPEYKESEEWVRTALSAKGMYEALDPQDADLVVEVSYGMEAPRQELKEIKTPIYKSVETPGTHVMSRPAPGSISEPKLVYVRGAKMDEVVGYTIETKSVIVVEKYLVLSAKLNSQGEQADGETEEVWNVVVTNSDDSTNLQEYLPVMVAAAVDYIGEDSTTTQTVEINSRDEAVVFVKKGLSQPSYFRDDTISI